MITLEVLAEKAARKQQRPSTGPKTNDGKAKSSRNAMTHGLRSESPVGPHESEEAWEAHLADTIASRQPRNAEQFELTGRIAFLTWKFDSTVRYERALGRIRSHSRLREKLSDPTLPAPTPEEEVDVLLRASNLLDADFHNHPALRFIQDDIEKYSVPEGPDLDRILRYRTAIERSLHKAEARLDYLKEAASKQELRAAHKAYYDQRRALELEVHQETMKREAGYRAETEQFTQQRADRHAAWKADRAAATTAPIEPKAAVQAPVLPEPKVLVSPQPAPTSSVPEPTSSSFGNSSGSVEPASTCVEPNETPKTPETQPAAPVRLNRHQRRDKARRERERKEQERARARAQSRSKKGRKRGK